MANLLLRSPQYKSTTAVGMLSAKIEVSIDSTLRYTIIKNAINNVVVFDISEISRDYITHTFGSSNPASTIAISTTLTQYTGLNGTGTATVNNLATFSSWLSVDQLHIPEEQVSL